MWAHEMEQIQAQVDVEGAFVQRARRKLIEDGVVLKVWEGPRVTDELDGWHLSRDIFKFKYVW